MLILEKDIEAYLKARVEGCGGKYIKMPAVYESGLPDRLVLLPGGKIAFVELKRPKGGVVAELQKYQIERLRALGFVAEIVKDYHEVNALIEKLKGKEDSNEV